MLKTIFLESPGVIKSADEIRPDSSWRTLMEKAGQQGIQTILFSSDVSPEEQCSAVGCLPKECLLLATDSECLLAAGEIGMPCAAYGEAVPAFRTRYQIMSAEGAEFHYLKQIYQRLAGEEVVIVKTKRLMIREMMPEDAESLWEIQRQEEVLRYTEGVSCDHEEELEKHRAYVEHVYPMYGYGLWAVCLKDNKKLIGRCGIQDREYNGVWEVELGYLLDSKAWGQGYATEAVTAVIDYAFNQLEISEIVAWIEPENERSIRVAKKAQMKFSEYRTKNGKCFACYNICKVDCERVGDLDSKWEYE